MADLAQWLRDHGACEDARKAFAGMTFQQAWRVASPAERDMALHYLFVDGVITKRDYLRCDIDDPQTQNYLCEPCRIVFYDEDK